MYIVKNIIENNGGKLEISSVEGEGTEVRTNLVI
jgi:signal transduction histidine kinase